MATSDHDLLGEQIRYYRERAAEYDEWFLRLGRYDRGEEHRRAWAAEVALVEAALREAAPGGDVLELACGTGWWTQHLAPLANRLTAIDAAPETIAFNRERVQAGHVGYVVADIFGWQPPARYDFVFFGFWLSHVPPECFAAFWDLVAAALKPGGRAFFVDSLYTPESTARDHRIDDSGVVERRLNDGRRFRIVKVFYEPGALLARLQARGWRGYVRCSGQFFVYGCVQQEQI
jgi:SAM-dependent methyltransferase